MNNIELYTSEGWINIPALAASGAWLFIIVGPRQVGKTTSTLKWAIDSNIKNLYIRRTEDELQTMQGSDDLNPFLKMSELGYDVDMTPESKHTYAWGKYETIENKRKVTEKIGTCASLYTLGKMRGFGGQVTDIIFDEFIPSTGVVKRKNEGEMLQNVYTTVCGNRELSGGKPVRMWLLANAFDLNNSILRAYGVQNELAKMARHGEEVRMLDGGCLLCFPKSEKVIQKREETAQIAFLRKRKAGNRFLSMAQRNEFLDTDLTLVRPKSLRGWKPLFGFGDMYIWENEEVIYCCRAKHTKNHYANTETDKRRMLLDYPVMKMFYTLGLVSFSDTEIMYDYIDTFC